MCARIFLAVLVGAFVLAGCGGPSGGDPGGFFQLIQFLESGKDSIPRNRTLTFRFSTAVRLSQDFAERLKIENVQTGPGQSNFARAIGVYVVDADRVQFVPRLPNKPDRSDAGFKANGNYHVFLKAGPDALEATTGDRLTVQQEFLFDTGEFFEDTDPTQPPRALALRAYDEALGQTVDISRQSSDAATLATLDSGTLVASGTIIEPGGGGAPSYGTPWHLDLVMSEAIDPLTVDTTHIKMVEIRNDALVGADSAPAGHVGTAVNFQVPITVEVVQKLDENRVLEVLIRVTPLQTLVDDARYRLSFAGSILGLDYRQTFIGDNGLTGDGIATPEAGGLGYVAEFLVYDRPAIDGSRTLTYDPLIDGIQPEQGQTAFDESLFNSAIYNPVSSPGTAVGLIGAFGKGIDGDLSVGGGVTYTVDTGDTPNPPIGENPFEVLDLNPNDIYDQNTLPGGLLEYDTPEPFELELSSLTVSSGGILEFIGVNPVLLRVTGMAQITGTIDLGGKDGQIGGGTSTIGGKGGAGGFDGGNSKRGPASCRYRSGGCTDWSSLLNACGSAKSAHPYATNGSGPGRGYAGGDAYVDYITPRPATDGAPGGGGGSHATQGIRGEDRRNSSASPGTGGTQCTNFVNVRFSGVVGVRCMPGPVYGDREIDEVLLGGSGGGGGGGIDKYSSSSFIGQQAGGSGGGGGGSLSIISAGPILANGGAIDATGGGGGNGKDIPVYSGNTFRTDSGGGGGGAGGAVALISGSSIDMAGAVIDTTGGTGGARATTTNCNSCNAGGAGGLGYILLMDADGVINGMSPNQPGEYDSFATGILTISDFDATRFDASGAITELFGMTAANPDYVSFLPGDVVAHVNNVNQRIRIQVSSAKGNLENPLLADPTTEFPAAPAPGFEVALVRFLNGGVVVEAGLPGMDSMDDLNPGGVPGREAFSRCKAVFEYDVPVEAALGPFAYMDQFVFRYTFNG